MRIFIVAMLTITAVSFSETVTQTDWSGGAGVQGPVLDWGDEFYEADSILFTDPSNIVIASIPTENIVDGDFAFAYSVSSADIDGDGHMDVLGAAGSGDDITWWENTNGSGTVWVEHTVDENFDAAHCVCAADVDGDGHMDVLGAAVLDGDITWWENANDIGTIWVEHSIDENFSYARSVYAADVDGDGDIDVLGAAQHADDITWWENTNGTGTLWAEHTVDGNFEGAFSVYAADVDSDGDIDVLGAGSDADDITWWENTNGIGTVWVEHSIDENFSYARSVYAADVDGDGDMDVLGAAYMDSDITWWENANGIGTVWVEHTIFGDFYGAQSVYAADVDGDGDVDVLGSASGANDITWWENMDGSGTIWFEHTVDGNFDGANSVHAADVNGDGHMDVLGSASGANDITWWDLNDISYLSSGYLTSSILDTDLADSESWLYLNWNSTEPTGTGVQFQVRASDNSAGMGSWSSTITSPCSLSTILNDGDRYFQYKVFLETNDTEITPILLDITVTWQDYVGTGEESESEVASFALYGARPNPALGNATLVFSLPIDSRAELTVYDLTGRTVHSVNHEYSAGIHEVMLENLASGVYLIRMNSADITVIRSFVVLE